MNYLNQSNNPNQFYNLSKQEAQLGMLMWVLTLFTGFIGPLVIWILKKDESEYLNQQGKNYFNYAISYSIYMTISILLMIVLIGYITTFILIMICLIYIILGITTTSKGEDYVVPFSLEFIK